MKPFYKAILFLVIISGLDYLFRTGLMGFFMPFVLPYNANVLILFTAFTALTWFVTKWFCKRDQITLKDLGISWGSKNRMDFLYGFLVGVVLWGLVSVLQSICAGFSWQLRPNANLLNICYGLIFIFIADLGTELFYRGYPLTRFKDSFGEKMAIVILVLFVGLRSYSSEAEGELLLYIMLIPALHTLFFSIIYFKTKRLGAALGLHTGANFITISIFDLRETHPNQAIPEGVFQSNVPIETLSLSAIQLPWIIITLLFCIATYYWWQKL